MCLPENIPREIRILARACPFVKARFPKFRTFLMSSQMIYEWTMYIEIYINSFFEDSFVCTFDY